MKGQAHPKRLFLLTGVRRAAVQERFFAFCAGPQSGPETGCHPNKSQV